MKSISNSKFTLSLCEECGAFKVTFKNGAEIAQIPCENTALSNVKEENGVISFDAKQGSIEFSVKALLLSDSEFEIRISGGKMGTWLRYPSALLSS